MNQGPHQKTGGKDPEAVGGTNVGDRHGNVADAKDGRGDRHRPVKERLPRGNVGAPHRPCKHIPEVWAQHNQGDWISKGVNRVWGMRRPPWHNKIRKKNYWGKKKKIGERTQT